MHGNLMAGVLVVSVKYSSHAKFLPFPITYFAFGASHSPLAHLSIQDFALFNTLYASILCAYFRGQYITMHLTSYNERLQRSRV